MNKRVIIFTMCIALVSGTLFGMVAYYGQGHKHLRKSNYLKNRQAEPRGDNVPTRVAVDIPQGADSTGQANNSNSDSGGLVRLPPVVPELVKHGSRTSKLVALTFDLCEAQRDHAGFDTQIVRILTADSVKATFFMGGKWAETHPGPARILSGNPLFEIGNHSYSHRVFTKISPEEAKEQVLKAQASLTRLTGKTPKYFRFPAGSYTPVNLKMVGGLGLKAIQWDVVTGDPDRNVACVNIIRAVKNGARGGSIIIMHANGRGWHTAEALPDVIAYLRGHGYTLATISELLNSGT
ncbi:MAG TPA: polysaccharide deacetylase family protein [Candidatus Aquicultor sp.]|jgi:peptidoglycan/xylan/chitin deacetylase (PgdA/CDA1 family)